MEDIQIFSYFISKKRQKMANKQIAIPIKLKITIFILDFLQYFIKKDKIKSKNRI